MWSSVNLTPFNHLEAVKPEELSPDQTSMWQRKSSRGSEWNIKGRVHPNLSIYNKSDGKEFPPVEKRKTSRRLWRPIVTVGFPLISSHSISFFLFRWISFTNVRKTVKSNQARSFAWMFTHKHSFGGWIRRVKTTRQLLISCPHITCWAFKAEFVLTKNKTRASLMLFSIFTTVVSMMLQPYAVFPTVWQHWSQRDRLTKMHINSINSFFWITIDVKHSRVVSELRTSLNRFKCS